MQELVEAEEFGVEVGNAMLQVISGAHGGEESEEREAQVLGKDWQADAGEQDVDANGSEECALASHVGAGDNVVMAVIDTEVIAHGLRAKEGMPEGGGAEEDVGLGRDTAEHQRLGGFTISGSVASG